MAIVLQEKCIWVIHDVLFHRLTHKVSKRSSVAWETLACERTVSCMHTLAFALSPHSWWSSLRLRPVLGTRFPCQVPNHPMISYGKVCIVTKLIIMFVVCSPIWDTMPWYGLQQASGNRYKITIDQTVMWNYRSVKLMKVSILPKNKFVGSANIIKKSDIIPGLICDVFYRNQTYLVGYW